MMMIPRFPSLVRALAHGRDIRSLGGETASERVNLCTFSTTKRLRHSGNTKPARVGGDPLVIEVRCSSTRLAHFDQLERFSQSPRREPSDCSSCRWLTACCLLY